MALIVRYYRECDDPVCTLEDVLTIHFRVEGDPKEYELDACKHHAGPIYQIQQYARPEPPKPSSEFSRQDIIDLHAAVAAAGLPEQPGPRLLAAAQAARRAVAPKA